MDGRVVLIKQLRNANPTLTLREAFDITKQPEMEAQLFALNEECYDRLIDKLSELIFQESPLQMDFCRNLAISIARNFNIN